ncbi:MAG: trypsin-like peptidase domain-containing protein, partial [Salinisphaera sp.]|nr:trypsin-like peptidase domain-containing protein [Salinisphaera sp.]
MPPSSVIRVRRLRRTVALLWLLVPMVLAGCGNGSAGLPDFTELVDRVAPAVVNISVVPRGAPSSGQQAPGSAREDWLKQYFHDRPPSHGPSLPSLGSGFIISEDGYILTAGHVVSAPGRIVVKLQDRRQLEAKLVGSDEYSDIALLKVDASDLPTVAIGDVDVLEVGAWVIAIGSPFGFETSVTAGIVSAKRRSLSHDQYVPFIQTDVAINPGNSGGPLFNMAGEVVGVNSQIYSRNGGFQGVSFALPIDIAMGVAQQLRRGDGIKRG